MHEDIKWIVINYKVSDELRLIQNLSNQNLSFFIPKILVLKNSKIKTMNLFPGYAFVQFNADQMPSLQYTKGLKYVVKSGSTYPYLKDSIVSEIKKLIRTYEHNPLTIKPKLDSEVQLLHGPLQGNIVKVLGFSSENRVQFLYKLLGRNAVADTELYNIKIIN